MPRSGSITISAAEEADDEPDRLHQLAHRPRRGPPGEHGAGPDADRELRDLGRLDADRAEDEPAVRAVDRRRDASTAAQRDEGADEEHRRERPERVVVDARERGQQDEPGDGVEPLLDEEAHRVALAERGRCGRRAEDHHEPERDEPERDEDQEPLLELPSVGTASVPHPGSFCTRRRNSSPRCSKLVNWSNEAQAGDSSTTSPAAAAARAHPRAPCSSVPTCTTARRPRSSADGELGGGLTYQVRPVAGLERGGEAVVRLGLAPSAEDHVLAAAGEGGERA